MKMFKFIMTMLWLGFAMLVFATSFPDPMWKQWGQTAIICATIWMASYSRHD